MVNAADTFISPGLNDFDLSAQPAEILQARTTERMRRVLSRSSEQLPRRSRDGEEGYDVFAIIVVNCRNDHSPVGLVSDPPAPQAGDVDHYAMAVHRLVQLTSKRYRAIAG